MQGELLGTYTLAWTGGVKTATTRRSSRGRRSTRGFTSLIAIGAEGLGAALWGWGLGREWLA